MRIQRDDGGQRRAGLGQVQVTLALVGAADAAFDQPVLDQGAQHAVERLLGDPEDRQQIVDRGAGRDVDEVDGAGNIQFASKTALAWLRREGLLLH